MKTILIVEDDPNIVAALEVRLRESGYATLTASDAATGFSRAVQYMPDLVMLDISLPAGDGISVARKLRSHPQTANTPFLFITANKDPELREQAMDIGAAGLFDKPYDADELLAVIGHALGETGMFRRPIARYTLMPAPEVRPGNGPARKVLIVEDDEKIALALSLRLRSAGYDTCTAPDAVSGVRSALSLSPDLVLLDISLPAGSGFTVAEQVRRSNSAETPIIFLTASKQPGFRERALELGAAGYFEKPYEPEALMTAVQQHLGR